MEAQFKRPAARAIVHVCLGLGFIAALHFLPRFFALSIMTAGAIAWLTLDFLRVRNFRIKRWLNARIASFIRPEEDTRLTGASYYLVGSLVTAAAFPIPIASLAIAYLALGDPAAALIGRWKGRKRLWGKYVEANLAILLVCVVIAVVSGGITGMPPLIVAVIGAVSAALFHALPIRVNDNLTIPIGSALTMWIIGLAL